MKVIQEGNDKGPGTPPRQPLCEKNMSPDSSFLKALQENNELESELISLSSLQKPMEKVLESRSQKENCSPLKGLGNCPPRSSLSTKQNQASKLYCESKEGESFASLCSNTEGSSSVFSSSIGSCLKGLSLLIIVHRRSE
jgi:hypothetical protein